jgi:4-amino-4-deoxy-L-arabinose transferase-like glycosyltransferase
MQHHYHHSHNRHHQTSVDIIILTIILSLLFGLGLGMFPLHTPDTARYAEIPREMIASGDYLTPYLNALKYFEKPPLFYWMQVVHLKLFGINIFAANLTNALMALFTSLAVYLGASKIYGRLTGFLSTLVLATSLLFFYMDRFTTLDLALTFFLTVAMLCFVIGANLEHVHCYLPTSAATARAAHTKKYYLWSVYIATGLAVMTKGLVGMIFPAAIIFIWITLFNEWRSLKNYYLFSGLLLFLVVAVPWHVLVNLKHPEFFQFYFIEQHFLRYFTPYAGRQQAWWFFPLILTVGLYPWVTFAIQAIKAQLPHGHGSWQAWRRNKVSIFLVLWAALVYGFYTFSNSQLIPYLLPVLPPLAILIGHYFALHWQQRRALPFALGFYLFATLSISLGIALFWLPQLAHIPAASWLTAMSIVLAVLFIASGVVSAASYYFYGVAKGCIALMAATIILLLSSLPMIAVVVEAKTILPLAQLLKPILLPQDEVASFLDYYHDLPYYLERRITVVGYRGELEFGATHHRVKQDWMIDRNTFWRRWAEQKTIYLIISAIDYNELPPGQKQRVYVLARYRDKLLVTNQPTRSQGVPYTNYNPRSGS